MKTDTTFILIHGAWHAAWCWEKIIPLLSGRGYSVIAPDLPGHGADTKAPSSVTLTDYTECILTILKKQHQKVRLVGHSMAGIIIAQVAESLPEQISELIYVSAYIPQHGQSLWSLGKAGESRALSPFLQVSKPENLIYLQDPDRVADLLYHRSSEKDRKAATGRLQPQPLQPWMTSVNLGERYASVRKKVVLCEDDHALVLADQLQMSQGVTENVYRLDTDHSPFYSATDELADIFTQ